MTPPRPPWAEGARPGHRSAAGWVPPGLSPLPEPHPERRPRATVTPAVTPKTPFRRSSQCASEGRSCATAAPRAGPARDRSHDGAAPPGRAGVPDLRRQVRAGAAPIFATAVWHLISVVCRVQDAEPRPPHAGPAETQPSVRPPPRRAASGQRGADAWTRTPADWGLRRCLLRRAGRTAGRRG